MSVETIARRYATALADVVLKSGETETVKNELKSWEELIESNENLQTVFGNPSIAHLSKENILDGLLTKTQPSKTTANFLRVLLKNSRLTELGHIRFGITQRQRFGKDHFGPRAVRKRKSRIENQS